jgi:hypothetical protein
VNLGANFDNAAAGEHHINQPPRPSTRTVDDCDAAEDNRLVVRGSRCHEGGKQ